MHLPDAGAHITTEPGRRSCVGHLSAIIVRDPDVLLGMSRVGSGYHR
jgi:hypothetical protein